MLSIISYICFIHIIDEDLPCFIGVRVTGEMQVENGHKCICV